MHDLSGSLKQQRSLLQRVESSHQQVVIGGLHLLHLLCVSWLSKYVWFIYSTQQYRYFISHWTSEFACRSVKWAASFPINLSEANTWFSFLNQQETNVSPQTRRKANARNVNFRISLRWPIHIINPVDKTKLSCDSIDLIHKWLPCHYNFFVSIKISPTNLSNEVSWAHLNAYKEFLIGSHLWKGSFALRKTSCIKVSKLGILNIE